MVCRDALSDNIRPTRNLDLPAMKNFFDQIEQLILTEDLNLKVEGTQQLAQNLSLTEADLEVDNNIIDIPKPGYPKALELVAPRQLKRRGIQTQNGRNILMHAVAHIEFNAINLALDAAYRFRHQPKQYYLDWIGIAADEARHFGLIRDYLNQYDCDYSNLPAHNGLWEMAVDTDYDVLARMALVPRVLEARGLDVTPSMIKKLQGVGDHQAVAILKTIYNDEIGHVEKGSSWFFYHCKLRNLEPKSTFITLVEKHLHGELRGPFNVSARLKAGFDELEMQQLSARY